MPITAEKLRYRQINEYLSIVIFQLLHTSQKIVRGDAKQNNEEKNCKPIGTACHSFHIVHTQAYAARNNCYSINDNADYSVT